MHVARTLGYTYYYLDLIICSSLQN